MWERCRTRAFHLKRTINEGNHRVWKQPSDPQGLWEQALADPAKSADFVVAFEGDPVWQAVHARGLPAVADHRGERTAEGDHFPNSLTGSRSETLVTTRVNAQGEWRMTGLQFSGDKIHSPKRSHLCLIFTAPWTQSVRRWGRCFRPPSFAWWWRRSWAGLIGLERQLRHKPAGLRTNMFICFGSAMFTVLSDNWPGSMGGDHTRVAAQIIPGIGFIGAGSILHARGSVVGLTTAATLFVVASVGMATGGGLYITAIFATIVILLALAVLGNLETAIWNEVRCW